MSASSEENIISPGGRRRFTVSSASSMDVQGIAVGEHDDAVPFSADLRRSLQNVSARSSALHRAMTMLGPLQIRSSRYDVLPRRGSLSSIRRRRAKVRKVRSPSFRARSGSIQPVVICKRSSTWSLASQANTNNPSGGGSSSTHTGINDTGRLWVVCRRSPNNLSPARNASAFDFNADSTTLNGGVGGGYGGSLRRDHRSDSFLSLRSLDNVPLGSSSGASSRLRRSDTTTSKLQNRAVHRSVSTSGFHRDLGKSHSLPFSVPKPSAGQRKPSSNRVLSRRTAHASKSLGVENMDGGGGSGPVTGQDQTRPLSPGVAIWDRVITKHWHTLVAYLKPHDCQDLLYQYDIVTWQQYRTIQSTEDDKDASSHLLYALRAGPPDAVQTFIGLLARVPGQENLAYMLHQEMNNVPRDHIDDAAQEAKSYVSPERSSETIQVHRSTSQPWNMLESSSLPPVLSVSPPPATLSPSSLPATNGTSNATSPPPTSVEHVAYPPAQANRDTGDGSQRLGVVTVTNDQYSVVSKPRNKSASAPQSTMGAATSSSSQVTSDEGFVEQNSDGETPPPVPPHPIPMPDISQETCMADSTDRLYAGIPTRAPPPPDPPHHRHTGSAASSSSQTVGVGDQGTSPVMMTSPAMSSPVMMTSSSVMSASDVLSSGAGSLTHSEDTLSSSANTTRAYSLSQARAYSPRASVQYTDEQATDDSQESSSAAVATRYRARAESLHEKRAYSPRSSSSEAQIVEEQESSAAVGNPKSAATTREQLAKQAEELDRMQSSLLHDLETMRVESPPGAPKPSISILPGGARAGAGGDGDGADGRREKRSNSVAKMTSIHHVGQRSVDHTGRPLPQPPQQQQHPNSRSVDDLRLRPLPKSPEDQSPFRRGTIDSEHVSVPPPLALDSLQRGVEPIGRDSLQLENPLVRRRLPSQTSISGRQVLPYEVVGGGGGLEVPATGLVPPYETLTRVRGEADAAWTGGADAADARVGPVVVSPPYAEAQLLARENNPFAKIGGGGGGAANNIPVSASQEHATIMEVYADDTPDDVLAVSVEGNGGSFLDAEEPYDQGFIRPVANSRDGLRNQSVSSSEFSRTAVAGAASQSPSSREWVDSTSTTNPTPGALSMDSGELQIPGTPGNISRGSNERNIMAPSTGDELATPLELWMIAWISEYLYVDSDKVDASHFVASDMPSGLVADTTQGGKGICIVHLIFENLNVRQYKLGRKSILQSLAMGFNMREMKVVCRDVNHGQSMIMSMWTPHAVRDTIMRLAEEKSFVLLSAGIVLVRCTSRAVWCAEKKKHKKKKLRLSSKGKPKQDPVDLERVEVALDRTASELWLLMEPIENPIHHAVLTGNHILVDTLISIGLDINEPNKEGETPLHLASQIGHVEVVQLLADTGAAIHALNSSGMTPLHWAANQGNGEVVQVLLRAGADPNAVEQRHQATPLHTASVLGRPEVVQILLENGANVKAIDQDGHTASHLAVLFAPVTVEDDDLPDDYADILDILLCSGAQPTPRSHEWITPVHIASSQGQERLIQILLHYHADINAVDQRHWQTPLHFAAAAGKMSAVDLLVSSGADIAAIDKDGRTAGDVAATAEIRTYLEEQLQNLPTDFTVVGELEDEDDMLVTDV
eukprot:scpid11664/ scgid3385/ Ankyrin-3; Ankyrin-G